LGVVVVDNESARIADVGGDRVPEDEKLDDRRGEKQPSKAEIPEALQEFLADDLADPLHLCVRDGDPRNPESAS
jgi:hypothetical protein